MIFIVIWHISIHAQKGELASHNYITAFCITGVNLFILISGYFGIRLNWKNLLTLMSTVAFYTLATILCKWFITDSRPTLGIIASFFAPFCNTDWWFINSYFHLLLLSPIINIALEKASIKQYRYILGVFLFMSCIAGFFFKNFINYDGYNTFQFLTIYIVGNAINKFNLIELISVKKFISLYFCGTIGIFVCSFVSSRTALYNNPLNIISAVSLFCLIAKLNFRSKAVNYIASFMLPIYLIQDSTTGRIAYKHLYECGLTTNFEGYEYVGFIALYILVLMGAAFILDNARRVLLQRPINAISKFLEKGINIFNL